MNNNNKTLDELRRELVDSWKLQEIVLKDEKYGNTKKYYVSEEDYEELIDEEKLSLSYFYQTHVMPQPFFGNIKDPKIVVLGKNPTYSAEYEMVESEAYREELIKKENENKEKHNLWFKLTSLADGKKCTQKWWYETFEGLFDKNNDKEFENILKHVGIFNLCGYHSKTYTKFPSYYLENNTKLPTQICLKEYLEKLLTEREVEYIILIWGKDDWESLMGKDFFGGFSDKLLIVNEKLRTNHKILNAPLNGKKEKLKELFEKIREGKVEKALSK